MKTKIIVNPISGTQKHKNIDRIFEKYLKDYEIVYTKYQNHAFEISKNLPFNVFNSFSSLSIKYSSRLL